MEHSLLVSVFIFLAAAILIVPLVKLSGLGSVIGYLLAGVLIGPSVAGFITEPDTILHFSEFGVVMMLFLIGLELQPRELWQMRRRVFGLGGMQVAITSLIGISLLLFAGMAVATAIVIGMALSLSSTAVALRVMQDRGLLKTEAGQSAFSVLLFQDVIVIAMIALVPVIAENFGAETAMLSDSASTDDKKDIAAAGFEGLPLLAITIAVLLGMVVAGRLLLQPIFRIVAKSRVRETFTAIALALVIGSALLMQWLGLSAALGAFFAGVVLADSDYRHQLERDLEPFKAMLLGLFFISVGMSIDLKLVMDSPAIIVGSAITLLLTKALVLLGIGRVSGLTLPSNLLFACLVCQAGEFGFVLFQFAATEGLMSTELNSRCNAIIAISMAMTPLLLIAHKQLIRRPSESQNGKAAAPVDQGHQVLILGFGRVGQIASRLLHSQDIETTIIDHDSDHIEFVRQFGSKVYYGDAADVDLLKTAGAESADVILICIDQADKATETASNIKQHFPDTRVIARAINRMHMFDLMALDLDFIERETVRGSLEIGRKALELLGLPGDQVEALSDRFLQHDFELIRETWKDKDNLELQIDKVKADRELIKQTLGRAKPD